jgi:hypothetical protein
MIGGMTQWELRTADGPTVRGDAEVVKALMAGEEGTSELVLGARRFDLSLSYTRNEHGLLVAVLAELCEAGGGAVVGRTRIRPMIPAPALSAMDPWGRTGVRQGLRGLLSRAARELEAASA